VTQLSIAHRPTGNPKTVGIVESLADAEILCRANRARLTPVRRRVFEALHTSKKPLGAYDLADALASQGRRMAPITVYRALDFLIAQGLAHRLASLNAYIAGRADSDGRGATAFLICESCGGVSEVASPELAEALSKLHSHHAFAPRGRVLELTGRCARC